MKATSPLLHFLHDPLPGSRLFYILQPPLPGGELFREAAQQSMRPLLPRGQMLPSVYSDLTAPFQPPPWRRLSSIFTQSGELLRKTGLSGLFLLSLLCFPHPLLFLVHGEFSSEMACIPQLPIPEKLSVQEIAEARRAGGAGRREEGLLMVLGSCRDLSCWTSSMSLQESRVD